LLKSRSKQIEAFLNERKAQRRLFTIEAKKLEELISGDNDETEIKARYQALRLRHEIIITWIESF
ncbi:hypothetical protein AVEN_212384-1, partial [Araneus ventricosus]